MFGWLKKLLIWFVVLYVAFCAAVYYFPQYFFYGPSAKPSNIDNARANGFNADVVRYFAEDGTEEMAWYVKPSSKKQVIVFFHGNSYNVEKFYHKLVPFIQAGYGVLMPEYRGFGGVKGKITQKNLEEDALAAVRWLHNQGYKNADIVVYGMSLGSHMAINSVYQFQKNGNFAALVLEVPFNSLEETVRAIVPIPFPLKLIVRDKYENRYMLSRIQTPVIITGGSDDSLVPVKLAEDLYTYANEPRKIIVYQGGEHNTLYSFRNYADILNWLEKK